MKPQVMLRLDTGNNFVLGSRGLHLGRSAMAMAMACSWASSRNQLLGENVAGLRSRHLRKIEKVSTGKRRSAVVKASSPNSVATGVVKKNRFKINLDEYMITLEKPIGIRFAQTLSGKVYVEALAKKVRITLDLRISALGDSGNLNLMFQPSSAMFQSN